MLLGEKLQNTEGRFLIFNKPAGDGSEHEYLMLSENEIRGMVSFGIQSRNGKESYVYNISGMQSLTELYLQREIVYRELLVIFKGLSTVFESLSEYLLEGSGLLLDPEYIFEDLNRELFFIFIPGAENELSVSMRELALFLIKRTDHRDDEAVRDAYDFYKRVYAGDYSTERYLKRETAKEARGGEPSYGREARQPVNPAEAEAGWSAEAEGEEPEEKGRISEKTVYGVCAAGLIFLASFISLAAFYSPEGIGRIFYNSEAVAVSGIIGAILVLIPVLYSNKKAGSKPDKPAGERKKSPSGTRSGLYYLSADREGAERSIFINEFPFTIGKAADCGGIIDSRAVSRHHARIDKRKGGCYITDLGSTNGTSLGGIKLEPHRRELLSCGDEILFADRTYYYWKTCITPYPPQNCVYKSG